MIYGADGANAGDVQLASATAGGLPVQANLCSDFIMVGGVGIAPQFALINVIAAGDATIVSAVNNKKIRVLSYVVTGDTAGTFRWESPAGTPISGLMVMTGTTVGSGYVEASFSPVGHFESGSGSALTVEMTAATDLQGHLTYIVV